MRFGMNMLLWTTEMGPEHDPILKALAEIGYGSVELPLFNVAGVDAYAALGAKCRALGLQPLAVTACGPDHNLVSPDPAVRAAAKAWLDQVVDCAAALGTPTLSGPFHSAIGVFSGAGPTAAELAWSVEGMRAVAARAAPKGVKLAIEPLNRFECYLVNDLAGGAALAKQVGHGAGVLYDTFHSNIEEKDPVAAILRDAASIALVHISENDRSTPGQGQARIAESMAALKRVGYDGDLVVEAFGLALPALSAATKIWRRMFTEELTLARDALAYMQARWVA